MPVGIARDRVVCTEVGVFGSVAGCLDLLHFQCTLSVMEKECGSEFRQGAKLFLPTHPGSGTKRKTMPLFLMKADVYETQKRATYLLLPQGAQPSVVPQKILQPLSPLRYLKAVELDIPQIIGADPAKIRADLDKQGYSLCQIEIKFDVST